MRATVQPPAAAAPVTAIRSGASVPPPAPGPRQSSPARRPSEVRAKVSRTRAGPPAVGTSNVSSAETSDMSARLLPGYCCDVSSPLVLSASRDASNADDVLFDQFLAEVARAQLDAWLPAEPSLVLDLSLKCARAVGLMLSRGHRVVHADLEAARPDISSAVGHPTPATGGRLVTVQADPRRIDWLADASVDALVAEGGVLSESLATEITLDDIRRVLRPGGRLLMCVDSLVSGLSRLAGHGGWAELADGPAADVVLVPSDDGHVSRYFWPEELHGMLTDAGFEVDWIRPRTVLAEETVVRALRFDRTRMESLVATELGLSRSRQGESIGARLVASAVLS